NSSTMRVDEGTVNGTADADMTNVFSIVNAASLEGAADVPTLDAELLAKTHDDARAAALERRLRRLAFDLHDGALQELSALARELASVRRQVLPLVAEAKQDPVDGRFEDVQARLASLDGTLRSLVGAVQGWRDPVEALDT